MSIACTTGQLIAKLGQFSPDTKVNMIVGLEGVDVIVQDANSVLLMVTALGPQTIGHQPGEPPTHEPFLLPHEVKA